MPLPFKRASCVHPLFTRAYAYNRYSTVAAAAPPAPRAPRDGRGLGSGRVGGRLSHAESEGSAAMADAAERRSVSPPLVILKKDKARIVRSGTPMVYGDSVDCVVGRAPAPGAVVIVADKARTPLAWGLYNDNSMYHVRVLQTAQDVHREDAQLIFDVDAVLQQRIREAVSLRRTLACDVGSSTAAYRLLNSEGDGTSGLVVDVFADAAVAQVSALWIEQSRSAVEKALLSEVPGVRRVLWRRVSAMLRLETGDAFEESDDGVDVDAADDEVEVVEDGLLRFAVDLRGGQKTGFYCDQRENRRWLRALPLENARVLDLCCYTGGFSLSAAAGGAKSVLGVDSSEHAVALASENARRNGFSEQCLFQSGDAIAVARELKANGEMYDVVVLDPPKLAPSAKAVAKAKRKYAQFNAAAIDVLKPGGMLVTCSCSGAVARTGILSDIVADVAHKAGRRAQLVRRSGAAPDHPISAKYPESQYLDCLCYVIR